MNITFNRKLAGLLGAVALSCAAFSGSVWAGVNEDVVRIRSNWESIKYRMPEKEQEEAMEKLSKEAAKIKANYPNEPSALIWHGLIEASYAGLKGGLKALSLVKSAKSSFEDALEVNANALEGSAFTSLGSLYYQVPGWPLGFGDDKKAAELLKKGLAINPNGIDSNFFYGDFLFRSGDYDGAEKALKKALLAAPREGRALADEGRRKEVNELLAKIEKKQQR
jgi:tetratricopeptide (TPR) repeat protein